VSASQNLRADQHLLRVSKLFSRNDTPQQHCLCSPIATHAISINTVRAPSCRLLVPHKRGTDCAWRSGRRVDKQERVSAVVHVEISAWAFPT
jgi:hypothetical protein